MTNKKERHILALSGGKDSAALAVYMREKYPELPLEYVFTDSGHELPETYAYLEKIRGILNIDINIIKPKQGFEYWLKYFNGVLPSANNRWCTRLLKLKPYTEWLKKNYEDSNLYSYVGLRADEDREGFRPTVDNFYPIHPFMDDGITLDDVKQILISSGIGLPGYYDWRTRSGCFFCFYQTDDEWRGLRENHFNLFKKAIKFEENHSDGRSYTWRQAGSLSDLGQFKQQKTPTKTFFKRPLLSNSFGKIILNSNEISLKSLMKE
ncbi:MAG: phosphoadenosine phosphosulfate reductase family protein [Desulfobacterium sp.]|nr:phosphoadenosine phosphosulfate reductase family protein [Desulfobacterium sp.]